MQSPKAGNGFTLIELVVVIVLTGIISLLVSRNISRPVEGFIDLGRRAVLVDTAELILRRMSKEIRLALPNSLRITDGATQYLQSCTATSGGGQCAVEILRTVDAVRVTHPGRHVPDVDVPEVEGAVPHGVEIDGGDRLAGVVGVEEEDLHGRGILGEDREVSAVSIGRCAQRVRAAGPGLESGSLPRSGLVWAAAGGPPALAHRSDRLVSNA